MVILGLGSNLGERVQYLKHAVAAVQIFLSDIRCSPVYESSALLAPDAPEEWNMPFLNMAIGGSTALVPQALLTKVKAIEQALGRKVRGHWGPREIDIDILAYGDRVINESELVIPHSELLNRDFALLPLADIAPDWIHPVVGRVAQELAANVASTCRRTDIIIE